MTILYSKDFFPDSNHNVAVESRTPQCKFPEHHHYDFHEIVLVKHGYATHILNGQPQTLCAGCVCFIRDQDRHLYEQTNNLHLTNILYRSPGKFRFLSDVESLLPNYEKSQSQWRVNQKTMLKALDIATQIKASEDWSLEAQAQAQQEQLFLTLLILLRNTRNFSLLQNQELRLNHLLDWLDAHYSEDIEWKYLADRFSLSLRTLYRKMKQLTGITPQRYLNRLRLLQARHMLRHSDSRITDIAFRCGFSDSNHFSTLFRREFGCAPRVERRKI